MKNRNIILSAAGLVIVIAIILSGCSTKNPWNPNANTPLVLTLVSGPPDSSVVPYGGPVSFSWTTKGGSGQIQYQYSLDSGDFSALSRSTTATFTGLAPLSAHTVTIRAVDAAGNSQQITRSFTVSDITAPPLPDVTPPIVFLTQAPEESSYVAAGGLSSVSFTWDGYDSLGSGGNLLFRYAFNNDTSAWVPARTVTFANLVPTSPATFSVWAMDTSGNVSPVPASVLFFIKNATVLYVDDFQWLDPFGNVDRPKERDQKRFYHEALTGFAIADWDVAVQGVPPFSVLNQFNTVVWAYDSNIGLDALTWFENPALYDTMGMYLSSGKNLLLAGAWSLIDILADPDFNMLPSAPGTFTYDWLGVNGAVISDTTGWWRADTMYDYSITPFDSAVVTEYPIITWNYDIAFTWANKAPTTTLPLPDSMKIDVAKNGDQVDYAHAILGATQFIGWWKDGILHHSAVDSTIAVPDSVFELSYPGLRNDASVTTEELFVWGLDIDGAPSEFYGAPVAHLTRFGGVAHTALLGFDAYSMPLPGMKQTFRAIMSQFGEGFVE